MTRKILANDAAEIKSLIDIIEPENIICLGLDTSVVVIRTLLDKKFSCNRVSELIGTGEPYTYGETYIYPVAHPGYWGTSTRRRIMLLQIGGGLENKEVPQCHLRLFATI